MLLKGSLLNCAPSILPQYNGDMKYKNYQMQIIYNHFQVVEYSIRDSLAPSISHGFYGWTG
jgi:hypothetical protein